MLNHRIHGVLTATLLIVSGMTPGALAAQSWSGTLTGQEAIPANESAGAAHAIMTMADSSLAVQFTWQDMPSATICLWNGPPTTQSAFADAVMCFADWTEQRRVTDGTQRMHVNLNKLSSYSPSFVRKHQNSLPAVREAFAKVLAGGDAYIGMAIQQLPAGISIGTRLKPMSDW
ncbi:MAG TPA: hypothetical protein DGD08_05305 [Gemmatimonas aurantiaca]|uniref:CHRD domain-containing protein n=2 Tax=Gemmatimonas aurantiaca TaxID=173480 RepID=C1A6I0_GEMAT|nr:hypothetical protein [Gemmatimonas aurantiaca]BAH37840.1 hypothetical protein GAU_0798 [Gemmatimonas aurantiaca T-27]HCT56616.1 hypothetical protein [Gemmatimonas aurantiaca]